MGLLLGVGFSLLGVGYYNIKSMNSSIEAVMDVNIPLNSKAQDVENKLLSLSVRLYDVVNSDTAEDLEKQTRVLQRSSKEFEGSLMSFLEFQRYYRGEQKIKAQMAGVADLSRQTLDVIKNIPDLKRENLRLSLKANKSQADFVTWLPVFRQMLQELKLKAFDDYVDNLMLNLLTYQSLTEKRVLDTLRSTSSADIKKARKSIDVMLLEYENWADNLYSEMPEAQNEIGTLVANFKFSCGDNAGVLGQHEAMIASNNKLVDSMVVSGEHINEIKAKITAIQMLVEEDLSRSKEQAAANYQKCVVSIACLLVVMILAFAVLFRYIVQMGDSDRVSVKKISNSDEKASASGE